MNILVFVIVFLAVLTQSITGFGLALVSMGLLSQALGVKTTAPLIALVAIPLEFALLVWHRQALNWRAVWRLSVAALVVWAAWQTALPAIALGLLVGLDAERYVNPAVFRRVVLWLLIVTGLQLVF